MMIYNKKLFAALVVAFLMPGGVLLSQENFVRLIVPSEDTTQTYGVRQRFNGSTLPGSVVTINGTEVKVFPSGAFAAFLSYAPGFNSVEVVSQHPDYGTVRKNIYIDCVVSQPEATTQGFSIDYVRLVPDQDQWLVTGDVVRFRVKAQPGNRVTVMGHSMTELPDSITGGVRGVYQGEVCVKATDTLELSKVIAEMSDGEGRTDTASSRAMLCLNSRDYNRYARTRGKMPALYMGLGTDRLGGAKYGYIDTMVIVRVTGRIGDMDRLQLSADRVAWINKNNIALLPEGFFPPSPMLTSSFSVTGKEGFDYVKIFLPARLPFTSALEINPDRIEVDIFGATSNTNWITQMRSAKEVSNIWYRQISSDQFRVVIELKHKTPWGYSVYYDNNTLVVKVKHQPERLKLSAMTIAIDAGHGGTDNGALGSTGLREKDVNLMMALKLKQALEKRGAKVILTRSSDTTITTTARWQALVPQNPDILISIHNNSIGNSDPLLTKGTSTYYKYIGFRPLSEYMYDELLSCGLSEFGNVGSFNFTLSSPTEFVNVLLELAFMSNPEDEMKLMDPRFCDRMTTHIVKGLERFLDEAGN